MSAPTLTLAMLEAAAPDAASLKAAAGLRKPGGWKSLGHGEDCVWGEIQGSAATPYQAAVDLTDMVGRCSCPSRKLPCKHGLALVWMRIEAPDRFAEGAPPPWTAEWLTKRRAKAGAKPKPAEGEAKDADAPAVKRAPAGSALEAQLAAAAADLPPQAEDPEEARRQAEKAARQAESRAKARRAAISAGMDLLEAWIAQHLRDGVGPLAATLGAETRLIARRLADAKAAGLAGRLDQMAADLGGLPEGQRRLRVLQELGSYALIAAAWRAAEAGQLEPRMLADLERLVGIMPDKEDLLADPSALRVQASWIVAAVRTVVQADQLQRVETWLVPSRQAPAEAPPAALLLDYYPVSSGKMVSGMTPGRVLGAELVFYPSTVPLRALIAGPALEAPDAAWPQALDLAAALARHRARRASLPWLGADLLHLGGVRPAFAGESAWLEGGGLCLPLAGRDVGLMRQLSGIGVHAAIGIWEQGQMHLLGLETAIGPWWRGAA